MEISDIIGKGKAFEPPFKFYDKCIRDNQGLIVINFDSPNCYYEDAWNKICIFADHICDLLNKEHCNG